MDEYESCSNCTTVQCSTTVPLCVCISGLILHHTRTAPQKSEVKNVTGWVSSNGTILIIPLQLTILTMNRYTLIL